MVATDLSEAGPWIQLCRVRVRKGGRKLKVPDSWQLEPP